MTEDEAAVDAAATNLLDAFAANDLPRYFAAFAPDASFVFPNVGRVMRGCHDYAAQWQRWVDTEAFWVIECRSFDRLIQVRGDTAVFIHRTLTRSTGTGGARVLHERETIVFRRVDGVWLAAHEHVSPFNP